MLNKKSILITRGTGSFGHKFVEMLLARYEPARIVVFSRDELKQYEMAKKFSAPCMRYFLGDVRDLPRLRRAFVGIDVVVHAAALKQVPAAEYDPFEYIKTNVLGAQNVLEACLDSKVSRVVALSTDKAAAPINLYGATKLCSDKLFIAANNIRGERDIRFSVVHYGNVMGSRSSVIPFFLENRKHGFFPITDLAMTRFNIAIEDGVEIALWSINNALGGENMVPKIPFYRITDVATAVDAGCEQRIGGVCPGEKIHEEMITESDSSNTVDLGKYYAILPVGGEYNLQSYCETMKAAPVKNGCRCESGSSPDFYSIS